MSKLFSRSKSRLESAVRDLRSIASDDSALDGACFQLQQSLEFAIKYMFECTGHKYPWGHSVRDLIDSLENVISIPEELSVFKDKADLYTKWETDSRYLDSFVATVKDAKECVIRLKSLHDYIDRTYHKRIEVDSEIMQWCKNNAPEALRSAPVEELLDNMLPLYDKYKR